MARTVAINLPIDDETRPIIQTQFDSKSFLQPPHKTFKPLPKTIIQSIEADRRLLPLSQSSNDFQSVKRTSIDTIDDDDLLDETSHSKLKRSKSSSNNKRIPTDIRVTLCPDDNLASSQLEILDAKSQPDLHRSDPSLLGPKTSKFARTRNFLDHRFGHRIHSSFSSSTTLRSLSRRRSAQVLPTRPPAVPVRHRRRAYHLPRNSKWHIVRRRLHEIAMMNESYARVKTLERDLRWTQLHERIRAQVLDMREMTLLRQQDDGLISKKEMRKTKFNLKSIPPNETIHIERDGKVFSMGTRDLVLGRLLGDEDIQLDTFAQLDARRHLQVQQRLLEQQEGRNRLKKYVAFSFCLCNLSFIVVMFAAMCVYAVRTIFDLKSRDFLN